MLNKYFTETRESYIFYLFKNGREDMKKLGQK